MSKTGTKETNAVLDNHLAAAQRGDLEGVLNDFSEDSVLFLPQGPIRGIAELRAFYKAFLTNPPSGFPKAFELLRRDVDGEVAYIVWKAEPGVQLATDTFLVHDRKIMVQTFAASLAA
jgi:ketosteroid isomerase-like protein